MSAFVIVTPDQKAFVTALFKHRFRSGLPTQFIDWIVLRQVKWFRVCEDMNGRKLNPEVLFEYSGTPDDWTVSYHGVEITSSRDVLVA